MLDFEKLLTFINKFGLIINASHFGHYEVVHKTLGEYFLRPFLQIYISVNTAVLAASYIVYDAATTPKRSVNKHWWCFNLKKRWRRWAYSMAFKGQSKDVFLGKTRTFWPNVRL